MFDTTFFHNGLMQGIWAVSLEKVYVVGGVGIGSSISRGFIALTLNGGNTMDSIGGSSWVTKKTYRSSLYKVSFIKQ